MFLWEQTLSMPRSVWVLGPTQVSQKRWAGRVSLGAKWPWDYGGQRDPGSDPQNEQCQGALRSPRDSRRSPQAGPREESQVQRVTGAA